MGTWHDGSSVCIEPDASIIQEIVKDSKRLDKFRQIEEAAFIDGSKIEACANKYAFCGKHQKIVL